MQDQMTKYGDKEVTIIVSPGMRYLLTHDLSYSIANFGSRMETLSYDVTKMVVSAHEMTMAEIVL